MRLRTFTTGKNFFGIVFSSLLVSHLAGMAFIFIVPERLLRLVVVSSLCLNVGHLFWRASSPPLDWALQQLVAISVLLREEVVHVLQLCHHEPEAKPKS